MKTTTVTSRGVITLPAKLRQALGLKADDQLIAETTPEGLLLRPAVTLPIELSSDQRVREFDEAEASSSGFFPARRSRHAEGSACGSSSTRTFFFPPRSLTAPSGGCWSC